MVKIIKIPLTSTSAMFSKRIKDIKLLFTHRFNVMAMELKPVFKIQWILTSFKTIMNVFSKGEDYRLIRRYQGSPELILVI